MKVQHAFKDHFFLASKSAKGVFVVLVHYVDVDVVVLLFLYFFKLFQDGVSFSFYFRLIAGSWPHHILFELLKSRFEL